MITSVIIFSKFAYKIYFLLSLNLNLHLPSHSFFIPLPIAAFCNKGNEFSEKGNISLNKSGTCAICFVDCFDSYEAFLMQQQFHWFDKVKFVFIGLAIAMLSFLLLLTIFGLLATGSTRDRLYSSWRSRISGRVTIVLLFLLNYFIYICWLEIFTIVIVLLFMSIFFKNLCKTVPGYESENCLDFRTVGILFNSTESLQIWKACGVTLQQFCLFTDSANGYYVISYFSTAVVLLGLLRTMPLFEGEQVVNYQNEHLG
ncbi:Neuronal membrane glycoprotein M6-a [Trichinella pseudospiralis]